jgi:hypothetical protein
MLTSEQKLWRAVLEQAYADAEGASAEDDDLAAIELTRARRFLRADRPREARSLALICDFADIPRDRVVLWARQRYPAAA